MFLKLWGNIEEDRIEAEFEIAAVINIESEVVFARLCSSVTLRRLREVEYEVEKVIGKTSWQNGMLQFLRVDGHEQKK